MASDKNHPNSSSEFEHDDHHHQKQAATLRRINGARLAINTLALAMAITIMGVTGKVLATYNTTHVSSDFLLPLWPESLNVKPTVALLVGSAVIFLANTLGLLFSHVKYLRSMKPVHNSMIFIAPFIGLAGTLIGMAWFYAVNASDSTETLLSYSCRWDRLVMTESPDFNHLCKESRAGVYLSIILIPVEFVLLLVAGYELSVERKTGSYPKARNSA